MYSRQNADARSARGLRIPSNYSGNAFFTEADERQAEPETADARDEPEKRVSIDDEQAVTASAQTKGNAVPSGISQLFGKGQSGGIGFEELLILGLVFLISQNDTKDDLAFLLLLLLFIR